MNMDAASHYAGRGPRLRSVSGNRAKTHKEVFWDHGNRSP